jgi:putative glutamine amidotransferase
MRKLNSILIFFIIFLAFGSSFSQTVSEKWVLISQENDQELYSKWLKNFDSKLKIKAIYGLPKDSVLFYLKKSNGILISGGTDISSSQYGKQKEASRCEKPDLYRDSLETELIHFAMKNNIPLLGICRGVQMLNVANGGTLIIDIPADYGSKDIHRKGENSTQHWVFPEKKSRLYQILKIDSGFVVSHHHQAVDKIADGFIISCKASDGIIEAIEPKDILKYNFLIGVQWHPERMDYSNPYSKNLAETFIAEIRKKSR